MALDWQRAIAVNRLEGVDGGTLKQLASEYGVTVWTKDVVLGLRAYMTNTSNFELWGCGFNQFNQIDDSGDDVFKPTLIESGPASGIDILWAGWADLLCKRTLSTKAHRSLLPILHKFTIIEVSWIQKDGFNFKEPSMR